MAIGQAGAFFHVRLDGSNDGSMLLVRGEIQDKISSWQELLIGTHCETVFRGILPRLALFSNGAIAKGIAHIQTRIPQIEALVKALSSATHDDDLLALERFDAVEFGAIHEAAATELF